MRQPVFVILTPAFAAFEGDAWLPGVEDFVRGCNHVAPGVKINVLSFHFPVKNEREYDWYGNDVVTFSGAHKKGKVRSLMRWKQVWGQLDQIRTHHGIAGIFSMFCSECAFVGHYFARRHKLNHKIWVMGQDARKSNNQVRRIRPKPEELICISDFLVREFEQSHGITPAHMIPYGIRNAETFSPPISRDIDIIAVGSLIPLKQFNLLIDLVRELKVSNPDIQVWLIGDGPERKSIEASVHTSGLQHNIHLKPRMPHSEVLFMMQRSKLLLHPSSYEGLGLVCLEALACRARVLSFCKPFDQPIQNWHIAQSFSDMVDKCGMLLQEPVSEGPVLPFEADKIAKMVLSLFGMWA